MIPCHLFQHFLAAVFFLLFLKHLLQVKGLLEPEKTDHIEHFDGKHEGLK